MAGANCDFFEAVPAYADNPRALNRMRARWQMVVAPFAEDLAGQRLLDLAAHDGRWAYAYAAAGAAHVTAVEARADLIDRLAQFPDVAVKQRVGPVVSDVFAFLEREVAANEVYDIVAVLGFLYHTMDHYRLFVLLQQLQPKLIIVDSEFITSKKALVRVVTERTDGHLVATAQVSDQQKTLVGIPSDNLMEKIAGVLGYDIVWADPDGLELLSRAGVADYFRQTQKRRRVCYLIARDADARG